MLLVDERAGSKDLLKPLLDAGLSAELAMLEFGDVAFLGRGEKGADLWVGVEFKELSELGDAINSGRLPGHQLPGMVRTYERRYLLVEGQWRTNDEGRLMRYDRRRQRFGAILGMPPAVEVQKRLMTYATRGGLAYWGTEDRRQTIDWLTTLYHFWTDRALDEHKSHIAIYNRDVDARLLQPTNQFRQTVSTFPGVGREFLDGAEKKFKGRVQRAVLADPGQWAEVVATDKHGKTKRFGMKRATKLVESLK